MQREFTQEGASHPLAQTLGWFSIGLGAAELMAPAAMSRLIGTPSTSGNLSLMRAMGAREIGHGIAILTHPDSASPLWSRVAGDAADLAFLGAAHNVDEVDRTRLLAATAAVAGVTALDIICAQRMSSRASDGHRREHAAPAPVTEAITVNRPIEQVYAFWSQLENLARFMEGIHPLYRWTSDPQMAVLVMRTIASRGFRISGSGTSVTSTFRVPIQQFALMAAPPRAFEPSVRCPSAGRASRGRYLRRRRFRPFRGAA